MPYEYRCYGMSLLSQLALPELTHLKAGLGKADVRIYWVEQTGKTAEGARLVQPGVSIGPHYLKLEVPEVASFEVRNGKEIAICKRPNARDDTIRLYLLGSALGALMMQRGNLVLHGNAVRIGEKCLICVGHSGAGKSTLSAAFLQRGYPVLSDDVVPVDAKGLALPGFPRIKLWQDAADQLGIDTAGLSRLTAQLSKFHFPTPESVLREPIPVRWIYVLDEHEANDLKLVELRGTARFLALRENTYRLAFLDGDADWTQHLEHCSRLSASARIVRVLRPKCSMTPQATAAAILEDISNNP